MYSVFEYLLQINGLTAADVSKATGIRQSTLSNWKKRNNLLSGEKARIIADYFGVSVDFLMTGNKEDTGYYVNPETAQIAQEIFDDKNYRILFDAAKGSKPEDLLMAAELLNRLKETNPDG